MSFDPDKWLADSAPKPFDPDEWLKAGAEPESNYFADKARRFAREVPNVIGQVIASPGSALQSAAQLGTDALLKVAEKRGDLQGDELAAARARFEQELSLRPEMQAAQALRDIGRQIGDVGKNFVPDPKRDSEIGSAVATGAASLVPILASGGLGAAPAIATGAGMMGEQQREDAEQRGASPSQQAASFALGAGTGAVSEAALGVPALLRSVRGAKIVPQAMAGAEAGVDKLVASQLGNLGRMVPMLAKAAPTLVPIVQQAVKSAAREGVQEGLEQIAQNTIAKDLVGYDPTRDRTEGAGMAMLAGGIVGGGVGGIEQGLHNLDTGKNIAETAATLKAQQEQLLAGRRPAQMFPVDAEGKITNELPLPPGMQRVETERGVFHFNPQQITADEILSASAQGAENRALNLGNTSKPAAEAAAQAKGEPLVTVTERAPDGTEVRSAVINQSAAPKTAAEMQPGTTPGNSLAVEPVEKTLAGRSPNFLDDILQKDAQALAERQAAEAKEKAAREQRQRELDAKKENIGEAMQQAATVLADPNAPFAAVDGARKRVAFYAENNALGITQDQRQAAQRQQAALDRRLATLQPIEDARRALETEQRLAADAAALAAQKQQRTAAKQDFKQEVQAGRDATGAIDYTRLNDDQLAERAQAGDAKAEKILMQRADSAGDERPTLLDVLARVKLPATDPALGGELKLLAEGMTPEQRRKLIATKETSGLDSVAEVLRADHGFSQIQTPADVIDFVERALRGEDIRPDRTGESGPEFATIQDTFDLGGTPVGIDLPNEVRNLTPRWQEKTLAFESSLDKALYYAGGTNSETRDRVAARLAEQTGLTTGQIATLARQLRTRIEPLTRSAATTGTIRVPAQMRSDVAKLTGGEFAQDTKPAPTPEPTDRTTIDREWNSLARAFPKLVDLYKVRIGDIQAEFDAADYQGGKIPSNVEAAVWNQKRLIVIAARAWRDRSNGTALLNHEVAHLFLDSLSPEAKAPLRALHAHETATKTGPLYDEQGHMRGSIQFERDRLPVTRVASDPDLPFKEWFAERIAILNKDWAQGRMERTDTPLLRRLADDFRQLLRRIVQAFAARSNIDPDSELFETQFRNFINGGAGEAASLRSREAGTAYAQKKAQFATRPNFATSETPDVPAWPANFPNVLVMTTVNNLYAQGGYEAAKAGNAEAARDVVLTSARENKLFDLQKRFPDAILVPVRALERAGNNRLPSAFANYFGHVTGLHVDDQIVQTNQTGHTGSGSDYRMAHRPTFEGAVIPGRTYIIVDDVVTMGGTLGELRAHIESHGGKVGAITTLAAAQFSAQIALTPKTKLALETKFDQTALSEWLKQQHIYGGNIGALTEAEGRWLLAAKTLNAAGNRLAAQRRETGQPLLQSGIRPATPPAGPSLEFATAANDYVTANGTAPAKQAAAIADIKGVLETAQNDQLDLFTYQPELPAKGAAELRDDRRTGALRHRAQALKTPANAETVRAAYAGGDRISSIIPELVRDSKRTWDIRGATITTPRDVLTLVNVMRTPYVETTKVILLNKDGVVVHSEVMTLGSISSASLNAANIAQVIARAPETKNGYNVIISHNHPSGDPTPSPADSNITNRLAETMRVLGHNLQDHVITNGDTYHSFREAGSLWGQDNPVTKKQPLAPGLDRDQRTEASLAPWELIPRNELFTLPPHLIDQIRQVDPTALQILYLNRRNKLTAMERVSDFNAVTDRTALFSRIFRATGAEGATGIVVLAPDNLTGPETAKLRTDLAYFSKTTGVQLLDYAAKIYGGQTAAEMGLMENGPDFATGADPREARLQQIRDELDALQNSQEDQTEINTRAQALTDERDRLQAAQRAEQREAQAAASITDLRHPAAVATPEPGDAWAVVPKMTDAELRTEREKVGQHIVDHYTELSRAERALLNARIDAIRAEEKRREPEPRRDAEGRALVESIPKTDRRAALIAELQRGRALAGEGNRTGNDEALKEGTRLVRLAKERLDDEFPGWETAARPTTAQAPSAAPDATDTQPGANTNNAEPPKPPRPPETTEAAQPDDAEPSPFTGTGEPPEPIRPGKIAEIYGHSSYQPTAIIKTWRKVRDVLAGIRGPIPELPTFPASKLGEADSFIKEKGPTFYNGIREFYRALKSGNDYVQRTAEEQVARIARPLIEAGGKFNADDYAKLQQRQEKARRLRAENQPIPAGVQAKITALQSKMETNPYVLFDRLVLFLNFKWRKENLKDSAGNPITLPHNLNLAEVNAELQRLGNTIQNSDHAALIRTALDRHMQLVKDVAADLQSRELMAADQLANPYYFPHLTLEIERGGKTEQRELTPTRVRPGTEPDFRGYLQDPVGSAKPIETDYVRALYYHLVQVGAHNLKADAVENYARPYEIMQEVRDRAAQLTKTRGVPVSWKQAFDEEFAPRGYVLYGTDSRDAFPTIMVDRDKLARRLGAELTSEDLHQQLERLGMTGVRLLPDDLKETLMQGNREIWIVPARVAEALRGIADRETVSSSALDAALKKGLGAWKAWKLFMPWNHIRYEYGNVVADVEKIFSATPGTFKAMPAAAREIRAFWLGAEPSADLRAALKDGVINAITAQEMGGLSRLRAFNEFETTAQKLWNGIKARGSTFASRPFAEGAWFATALGNRAAGGDMKLFAGLGDFSSPELSAFREAVFRYANFKNNLEKIRAGERPDYGGAYHRDIDAMQDSKPGAGDRAERQAAQISKATFGDYGDLSVLGQGVRDKLIPFYSWMEVNFKYHANLFRNLRDMVRADQLSTAAATGKGARAAATFAAGFTARAAGGMVLRLALPYIAVALWNSSGDRDELEKELSDEDRRRFHIILGRTADGKVNVIYGQTALIDVIKWFSGAAFAQQAGAYLNGKTDFRTAFSAWKDQIVPDFLNNTAGSAGPYIKIPTTLAFKKNMFPDVTDMRTVPAYDMKRVVIGQAFDDFSADMVMRIADKDYYTSKDVGTWAKQLILQVRQRDPEQWAFYAIKDKAADFWERMTGKSENSDRTSKDQQVLRNFRRAIYKGDVEAATQFYQRLLDYGYTAERFKESIRSQEPLSSLPKNLRRPFIDSLTLDERELLDRAEHYYTRIFSQRGHERGLFPSQRSGPAGLQRYQQNPQIDRLRANMQATLQLDNDARQIQADRALRESLKKTQ